MRNTDGKEVSTLCLIINLFNFVYQIPLCHIGLYYLSQLDNVSLGISICKKVTCIGTRIEEMTEAFKQRKHCLQK